MTTITIQKPINIELESGEYLPQLSSRDLLKELAARLSDEVQVSKAQFVDLVQTLIDNDTRKFFEMASAILPSLGSPQRLYDLYFERLTRITGEALKNYGEQQ